MVEERRGEGKRGTDGALGKVERGSSAWCHNGTYWGRRDDEGVRQGMGTLVLREGGTLIFAVGRWESGALHFGRVYNSCALVNQDLSVRRNWQTAPRPAIRDRESRLWAMRLCIAEHGGGTMVRPSYVLHCCNTIRQLMHGTRVENTMQPPRGNTPIGAMISLGKSVHEDPYSGECSVDECRSVLHTYRKTLAGLGSDHLEAARMKVKLGVVHTELHEYEKAHRMYTEALSAMATLGGRHPEVTGNCNNIGIVCRKMGRRQEALQWYNENLGRMIAGKDDLDAAKTQNKCACMSTQIRMHMRVRSIATVYEMEGKFAEALQRHKKCLATKVRVLGSEHLETAETRARIALVYYQQGRYTEALEVQRRALAVKEKVLGRAHPDVAELQDWGANLHQCLAEAELGRLLALDPCKTIAVAAHDFVSFGRVREARRRQNELTSLFFVHMHEEIERELCRTVDAFAHAFALTERAQEWQVVPPGQSWLREGPALFRL